MAKQEKAIEKSKPQPPAAQAKLWLNKRSDSLAEWCGQNIDPATLIRVGARLVAKDDKFQDHRTWPSLYMALITSAQLGLEPDGPRGEAYLLPYWDKDMGCYLVQLMPGYRGIIKLLTESGDIRSIRSQAVHANDEFAMDLMDPDDMAKNYHRVTVGAERGDAVGVYSRVRYSDGTYDNEYANWDQVLLAKSSAKGKSPAWEKWPEQMARKFVIKRHANQLPLGDTARKAILVDNISSDSASSDARAIIDVEGKIVEEGPAKSLPAAARKPASNLEAKAEARKVETAKKVAEKMAETEAKKDAAVAKADARAHADESRVAHGDGEARPPESEPAFSQCELCGSPAEDGAALCGPCESCVE